MPRACVSARVPGWWLTGASQRLRELPGGRRAGRGYLVAVRKPLGLPFDPIARAAAIWERRYGDAAAMAAVTSIMRAQQILLAELDGTLRPHGLTFARYEALVLLSFSRTGALPLRLIGQRLMVHPTSVTNIIGRLERQRLVTRRPNPSDRRGTLAEITAAGRDLVARATADLTADGFAMSGYDRGELAELFTLLRGLRLTAGDFADQPAAQPGATAVTPATNGRRPRW
jgi:DNA-binding MarR family transcriptional regulator